MDNPRPLPPFPSNRYVYYGDSRVYRTYGESPPEDLLEHLTDVTEPLLLLLGCGDLRTCFYTLWKNFNSEFGGRFKGVRFVLNDRSAAVLARNILCLYLCFQRPAKSIDIQRWLGSIWAIWFCHELMPSHEHTLQTALTQLIKFSESTHSWSKPTNPLCSVVRFISSSTLFEVNRAWKMWYNREVKVESPEAMRASRKDEMRRRVKGDPHALCIRGVYSILGFLKSNVPKPSQKALEDEIVHYLDSGSTFAEEVLDVPLTEIRSVNYTFYDRSDGAYCMDYALYPFQCFFQAVTFSRQEMTKIGVSANVLAELVVSDDGFGRHTLLSNSLQQLAMWLSCSAKILEQAAIQEHPHITFTFECSDALQFCQQLQICPQLYITHTKLDPSFDAIYTGNLIDQFAAPNIVLNALPLLKKSGYLFTTSVYYKETSKTIERSLEVCFGVEAMLFPILCGVRCGGHEGEFTCPVNSILVPWTYISEEARPRSPRLLIWQHARGVPIKFPSLHSYSYSTRLLNTSVTTVLTSFFRHMIGLRTSKLLCTDSAVVILQSFASLLDNEMDVGSYMFWEPLSALLREVPDLRPFLSNLQTQVLLHGLHLHLTFTESICPLCTKQPITDVLSQFTIELSLPQPCVNPTYIVFVHSTTYDNVIQVKLLTALGGDVHIFDSLAATEEEGKLKLHFFAPRHLAESGYRMTMFHYELGHLHQKDKNIGMPQTAKAGDLASFRVSGMSYAFKQVKSNPASRVPSLGRVTQHFGTAVEYETIITLSDATMDALEARSIETRLISLYELQLSCSKLTIKVAYPFPVDYDMVTIILSRKNRIVTITTPRKIHRFHEEKPLYMVNPDNKVFLPPLPLSKELYVTFCGMQFTKKERDILDQCNRKIELMPPVVNLKEAMNYLFQSPHDNFFHLLFHGNNVHGLIVVHQRVVDIQTISPAIYLSFCFLDMSNVMHVALKWQRMIDLDTVKNIMVNDEEYKILQRVFQHFAKRTFISSKKITDSRQRMLMTNKLSRHFTPAVIYPLYTDLDVYSIEGDIDERVPGEPDEVLPEEITKPLSSAESHHKSGVKFGKAAEATSKSSVKKKDAQSKSSGKDKATDAQSKSSGKDQATDAQSKSSGKDKATKAQSKSSGKDKAMKAKSKSSGKDKSTESQSKLTVGNKAMEAQPKSSVKSTQSDTAERSSTKAPEPEPHSKSSSAISPEVQLQSTAEPEQKAENGSKKHGKKRKCHYCGNFAVKIKKCAGCGKVQYCGRECQKKHWKEHKHVCQQDADGSTEESQKTAPADDYEKVSAAKSSKLTPIDDADLSKCNGCGKETSPLRKCPCHLVAYCSVECQKDNWPDHKAFCTAKTAKKAL